MATYDDHERRSAEESEPPHGYQDIVDGGWTCTRCAVTLPRNEVLTRHHSTWHRELEQQLGRG